MHAIQTEGIGLSVDHFQLHNVNLEIPFGNITSIVGPNGSGKSTILKVISRLLLPQFGAVHIHGQNSRHYKTKEFAKVVSMLPQSKEALPNLTVKELVAFGRAPHQSAFHSRLNEVDETIIHDAMTLTNTLSFQDRLFFNLSGGEQQKVRIAMALAQNTKILLLDEPTTYLDIAHQLEVMELLQKINAHYDLTIIMVLHDLQQAAFYSDYMIAVKDGRIMHHGAPRQLLTSSFLQSVYNLNAKVVFEENYPMIIPRRS